MDKEMIDRFINNKVNDEKVLKDLTDNASFMKEVIKTTKDKRFYSLSSERLKTDFDFVLFIAETFDEELNFAFDALNYYVNKHNEYNYEYIKLMSIADKYLVEKEEKIHYTNNMRFVCRFLYLMDKINAHINIYLYKAPDKEKEESALGFKYIEDKYNDKDINTFTARYMLTKIFHYDFFYDYIHAVFKSKEDIENDKLDKYLIEYINMFDKHLGKFADENKALLASAKKSIEKIKINYEKYNCKKIDTRVNEFESKLLKFLYNNDIIYIKEIDRIKKEEIIKHHLEKEFNISSAEIHSSIDGELPREQAQMVRTFINIELNNIFYVKKKVLSSKNVDTKEE